MNKGNGTDKKGDLHRYGFKRIGSYTLDELRQKRNLDLNNLILTNAQLEFICNLAQLRVLTLSNVCMIDRNGNRIEFMLPDSISNLTDLRWLNLRNTEISQLPDSIGKLANLDSLDLIHTKITKLPNSIGNLINLDSLKLNYTKITKLPDSIGNLTNLRLIDLSDTRITELPHSIGNLTNLSYLNLRNTRINKLPDSIGELTGLSYLNLKSTRISALPEGIDKLTNLTELNLGYTKITEFPKAIGNLVNLIRLNINHTSIPLLPDSIGNLTKLEHLNLSYTDISELPPCVAYSRLPTYIVCEGLNELHIPKKLIEQNPLFETEKPYNYFDSLLESERAAELWIYIKDTTLDDDGLLEFIRSGASRDALLEYINAKDRIPLRENKVIFLGDGGVGKTYIIGRISKNNEKLDEAFDTTERTPGVAISMVQMTDDGEIIEDNSRFSEDNHTVKFWDFGGQEMLHSMHRCFLTRNTMYVVVVSGRFNDLDIRIRYWLDNIKDFAQNSDVIIVVNKTDEFKGEYLNSNRLCEDYKKFGINIVEFMRISALKDDKLLFRRLSDQILELVKDKDSHHSYPKNWIDARRELDTMSDNYINEDQYSDLCSRHNIENQEDFLNMLKMLGVVFTTKEKVQSLEPDYKVLKPVWLLNAIYAIIENGKRKLSVKNGIISKDDIVNLLKDSSSFANYDYSNTTYTREEIRYILIVMHQHMISLELDSNNEFIPTICKNEEPERAVNFAASDTLKYRMGYDNLPENVLHRLMLEFSDAIDRDFLWANGALFNISGCEAMVRREKINASAGGSIHISVNKVDDYAEAKCCLGDIREKLYAINEQMGISAKDYIVYETEREGIILSGEVEYQTLLKRIKKHKEDCWVEGEIEEDVPITDILKFAKSKLEVAVIEKSQGNLGLNDITLDMLAAAIEALRNIADSCHEMVDAVHHVSGIIELSNVDDSKKRSKVLRWLDKTGQIVVDAFAKALVSQLFGNAALLNFSSSTPVDAIKHL